MDVNRHIAFSGSHYLDYKAGKEVNMESLKTSVLIMPVLALILVIILYVHLLKHSNNRRIFKRFSCLIIAFSFLLNFFLEMLQMPLYKGMKLNMQSAMLCGLASLADTLMVLLLYYTFAFFYKEFFWTHHFTLQKILILMGVSATGAILVEIFHLSAGSWKYSRNMPLIPVVNVGVSPVLQFMILPILSYWVSFHYLVLIKEK